MMATYTLVLEDDTAISYVYRGAKKALVPGVCLKAVGGELRPVTLRVEWGSPRLQEVGDRYFKVVDSTLDKVRFASNHWMNEHWMVIEKPEPPKKEQLRFVCWRPSWDYRHEEAGSSLHIIRTDRPRRCLCGKSNQTEPGNAWQTGVAHSGMCKGCVRVATKAGISRQELTELAYGGKR